MMSRMPFAGQNKEDAGRPLTALALLLALPFVAGLLLTPWLYRLCQMAAEGSAFHQWRFEQVATRSIQLVALMALVPLMRLAGFRQLKQLGWVDNAGAWTWLGRGLLAGLVTMALGYAAGWLGGAFVLRSHVTAIRFAGWAAQFLGVGLLVAVFEETMFRGFVYGALRQRLPVAAAAALGSALFAVLHIVRPEAPPGFDATAPLAGLQLLAHLFAHLHWHEHLSLLLTVFCMAMTLCLLYERQRHLYFVIGLHAGWVWLIRLWVKVFNNDGRGQPFWFGSTEELARCPAGVVLSALFLLAVLVWIYRHPQGKSA